MNRRGSALAIVLFVMVLLLGLSAVAASQARLRWLAGARALSGARLEVVAQERFDRTEAEWDPQLASRLAIGQAMVLPSSGVRPAGLKVEDSLRRLGALLYDRRIRVAWLSPDSMLLSRVALQQFLQLASPALPDSGALHAGGGAVLDSGVLVDGTDAVPPAWGGVCPAPGAAVAGVRLGPGAVLGGSCASGPCLRGAPQDTVDGGIAAAVLAGSSGWYRLVPDADQQVSGAAFVPGPVISPGGTCDRAQPLNWGEPGNPASACGDFFPLIVAQPGTTITDGRGQGILLALGSITLAGNLQFAGAILAMGSVELRDAVDLHGTVIARDSIRVVGGAVVRWSSCALDRARAGAGQPARVAGWSGSKLP